MKKLTFILCLAFVAGLTAQGLAYTGHNVISPEDPVIGLPNDGDWPANEQPAYAIDGDADTKYLHFRSAGGDAGIIVSPGLGTGFFQPTTVQALRLTTANDAPGRDPVAYRLYGSNGSAQDGPWELIAAGDIVDFQDGRWYRQTKNTTPILFDNNNEYRHYRLLFPEVVEDGTFQIANVELISFNFVQPRQIKDPDDYDTVAGYNTGFHPMTDSYPGWRLGIQTYTFREFTLFEAIDRAASCGIRWIEAYPGQRLSEDTGDVRFDHNMREEYRQMLQKKLADAGAELVAYGVVDFGSRDQAERVFEFASDMGVKSIATHEGSGLDYVDQLANEYDIKVAFHNHRRPARYWHPDNVEAVIASRSRMMGACADIGHWMRSEVDPLEALRQLDGRIVSLHFKDLNEFGQMDAHDVPWGTGKGQARQLLEELHRQDFAGTISVEYEHNWTTNLPEIRQSVDFYNNLAYELSDGRGWKDLYSKDFSNARLNEGSWKWQDGELAWQGGGYIWTEQRYGDFILDLEFKVDPGSNSGVFFRTGDLGNVYETGMEVQIHDSTDGSPRGQVGAIYDIQAPSVDVHEFMNPTGQWNRMTLFAYGSRLWVVVNNYQVINIDLDDWTQAGRNPDGSRNKFRTPYKDMPREGHIGLQDHRDPVWYRNIRIKEL